MTSRRADHDIESAVDHYLDEGAHAAALDFVDAIDDADAVRVHRVLHTSRDLPVEFSGA
ncbi:hypothetical protein [Frigoribacterium sp. 9N]|uniref:hypothetical protein n=1 Tax=Frigoribacterium sp. 9N TaxID=2653144 RepID=UPI0012F3E150|nr:hypothetical protein [Frigoribacterium sp. 9N]VXA99136.1 conserved hypothetical protein [Frigoribacterium sp. 9N]